MDATDHTRDRTASNLKETTEFCRDSAEMFRQAAASAGIQHREYAKRWHAYARTRQVYTTRLDERLAALCDATTEVALSVELTMHRGLLNLKEIFSSEDFVETVDECLRSEEQLLEEVRELLRDPTLDVATRDLLTSLLHHLEVSLSELHMIIPMNVPPFTQSLGGI